MDNLQTSVISEFQKVAKELSADWTCSQNWAEIAKRGTVFRVRWSVERIEGVFVTLIGPEAKEYGLPYIIEFRGGNPIDIAAAGSDDPALTASVFKRFAADIFDGPPFNLAAIDAFISERAQAAAKQALGIRATKHVRPEWL